MLCLATQILFTLVLDVVLPVQSDIGVEQNQSGLINFPTNVSSQGNLSASQGDASEDAKINEFFGLPGGMCAVFGFTSNPYYFTLLQTITSLLTMYAFELLGRFCKCCRKKPDKELRAEELKDFRTEVMNSIAPVVEKHNKIAEEHFQKERGFSLMSVVKCCAPKRPQESPNTAIYESIQEEVNSKVDDAAKDNFKAVQQKLTEAQREEEQFYEIMYWIVQFAMMLWQSGNIIYAVIKHSKAAQISWWPSYNLLVMGYFNSGAFLTLAQAFSKVIVALWSQRNWEKTEYIREMQGWQFLCIGLVSLPLVGPLMTHSLLFFIMYPFYAIVPPMILMASSKFVGQCGGCCGRKEQMASIDFDQTFAGQFDDPNSLQTRFVGVLMVFSLLLAVIIVMQTSTSVMTRVFAGEVTNVSQYLIPVWNDWASRTWRSVASCGLYKLKQASENLDVEVLDNHIDLLVRWF